MKENEKMNYLVRNSIFQMKNAHSIRMGSDAMCFCFDIFFMESTGDVLARNDGPQNGLGIGRS